MIVLHVDGVTAVEAAAPDQPTATVWRSDKMAPMTSSPAQTTVAGQSVAALGEHGLVGAVTALLAATTETDPDVLIGPGDDAALVRVGGGEVIVSTDVAVEGRHFRRDWSSGEDVGHRVAASNLADIAAMGGRPRALVVALSAPGDLPAQWALDLTRGLVDEAAEVGARIVGGDVSAADQVQVAVTVLGAAESGVVRRGTASAGDVVAVTGRLGWAAAGYAVLSRGFRSPRVVVEAHRRPRPPYAQGPAAAAAGATALVDVSDGLLADLGQVARASGVRIDIQASAFDVPEPLQAVGAALGAEPMRLILTGGDDHALAATFPPDVLLPDGWAVVGAVGSGEGVTVDGAAYDGPQGHQHFT